MSYEEDRQYEPNGLLSNVDFKSGSNSSDDIVLDYKGGKISQVDHKDWQKKFSYNTNGDLEFLSIYHKAVSILLGDRTIF